MVIDKIILFPYWLALKVRHALFDSGARKSFTTGVPSVCVGNISAGGTGKTPHVEMILDILARSDEWGYRNLAVLSSGYKRKSRGFQQVSRDSSALFCGDEPFQIKNNFPAVTVAVDKDRVEGCRFLCDPGLLSTDKKARRCADKEMPPAELIILDDALQYRALRPDVNIILVEWSRPPVKDALLPLGSLRDLPQRLKAADILIVTKCPAYMEDWERMEWAVSLGLKNFSPGKCEGVNKDGKTVKLYFTNIVYCPLQPVFEDGDSHYVWSKKLIMFSGIADDTPLRRHLSDKYQVLRKFSFPDHHRYSSADMARIASASRDNPVAVIVTTQKDSQRVRDVANVPEAVRTRLFEVPIKMDFLTLAERESFTSTLLCLLHRPK